MNAILSIQNNRIQVDDATLEKLNAVLMETPLCRETYKDDKYSYPPQADKRLQLKPVFELKAEVITL